MRRARMLPAALALLAVAAAALPASAAAIRFTGETAKGVDVELRVSPGGTPKRFDVGPTRVRCRDGRVTQDERHYRRFDRARAGRFSDRFKLRIKDGGIVLRERTSYVGERRPDGSWGGTYRVNVRVYRKGERIDTCNLRTRWSATRAIRSGRR